MEANYACHLNLHLSKKRKLIHTCLPLNYRQFHCEFCNFENNLSSEYLVIFVRTVRWIERSCHGFLSLFGLHQYQMHCACSPTSDFQYRLESVGRFLYLILLCILVWYCRVDRIISKWWSSVASSTSADIFLFNILIDLSSNLQKFSTLSFSSKQWQTVTIWTSDDFVRNSWLNI